MKGGKFMPIVPVDGKQISYWAARKGLLEGKETILFIHGAGGGEYTWGYQKSFFEKEFNPVIIELPGHGASGGEGEQEIGKYAEQVFVFLKALGLKKVFLVGHSMGGAIVQTLALTHAEVIKGIILVCTGARLKVFPMIFDGIKNNFEESVRMINQYAFSPKVRADLLEKGISYMMQYKPEVLYGDFLACDRFDLMNQVEKITLPTLVLCGEDDQLAPVKYSQFLSSRIKGSKLKVLPNAGHMAMLEAPQAFNESIKEFILENSGRV